MNNLPEGLKAIMFDLGGVIIELHYQKTVTPFAHLAGITEQGIGDLFVTSDVLQRFEVGEISENVFHQQVCEILGINMERELFDATWNALLGDISRERIKAIQQLDYRTLILSNTNSVHERAFNEILHQSHGIESLHEVVEKVYFSHEVGLRKPDDNIYQYVLEDQQLEPDEILFIDDRADNIQAARQLGFQVFQNERIDDWMGLF